MACQYPTCLFLFVFFTVASAGCENAKGVEDTSKPDINFKDVMVSDGVCARLYVPKSASPDKKLPLVVYYHGGAFVALSAFDQNYVPYVSSVVKNANVVALSVEYRLACNVPIDTTFNDSWAALKWVASHSGGKGPEEWLNSLVDFERVFLSGDSAGATIAHNMAMRIGSENLGFTIDGMAFIHPYFWGSKPIGALEPRTDRSFGNSVWMVATHFQGNLDDPRVNPLVDPKLSTLGCTKILVLVATQDELRDRGFYYYETLLTNGWKGQAELMETPGTHTFHLSHPDSQYAQAMLKRVCSFYNGT